VTAAAQHVVVFGDSLTFHGPQRPEALTDPRLYPNVLTAALAASAGAAVGVDVVARLGWTARDGWWALTKDPYVATVVAPRAEAVVLGLGQMDQLPAAVPTYLRDGIPYLRPGGLRRVARQAYRAAGPHVIRASGGRLRQLPQAVTDTYLTRITQAMRHLSPLGAKVPVVLAGPSPYAAAAYPSQRPHRPAVAAARKWAEANEVAFVDLDPIVGPALAAGSGNPDGMHWGWDTHRAVGEALAAALAQGRP
jgi:diglucosylglycerate octanoyltransferase